MSEAVYACDIGSVRAGSFAWARVEPDGGNPTASSSIDDLASCLSADVTNDMSIALGFESPLFMPIPRRSADLSRGRQCEGNRSMFAPVGGYVTTLGVHEAAWILEAIRDHAAGVLNYTLDWKRWPPATGARMLLVWEAFVSGDAHSDCHHRDAATAALFFRDNADRLGTVNAVTAENSLSLVHAAALWAGWADDLERLRQGCLVLRPEQAYDGPIDDHVCLNNNDRPPREA